MLSRTAWTLRRSSCALSFRFLSSSSTSSRPFIEPSETADGAKTTTDERQRELLSAALDPPSSNTKYYGMIGSSVALGFGGSAVLTWAHYAALQPWLPDIAGVTMMCTGAGLAMAALSPASRSVAGGSKHQWRVEVVPLNDTAHFATAAEDIQKATSSAAAAAAAAVASAGGAGGGGLSGTKGMELASAPSSPPSPKAGLSKAAEEALSKAEAAAQESLRAARVEASEAALANLNAQLANGEHPRRLRQQLAPRVFVIDFDTRPPVRAGGASPPRAPTNRLLLDELREQVSLLLHVATPYDEVVLRVTSPGGPVTDYGLASAHFGRLKAAGVRTTACVDLVAASGGYMMACAADTILAAPFSIVGSIGVVAGVPNVHRLLEKGGVEYVQRTAGNYKRTVNIFTPNTEEGLAKFDEELKLVHEAFMAHVGQHRKGKLAGEIESVCTGESWLALNAEPLGLVDGLITSDAYLRSRQREADVFLLRPAREGRPAGLLALLRQAGEAAAEAASAVAEAVTPIRAWQQQQQQQQQQVDRIAGLGSSAGSAIDSWGGAAEYGAGAASDGLQPRGLVPMMPLDSVMPRADTPLMRAGARA